MRLRFHADERPRCVLWRGIRLSISLEADWIWQHQAVTSRSSTRGWPSCANPAREAPVWVPGPISRPPPDQGCRSGGALDGVRLAAKFALRPQHPCATATAALPHCRRRPRPTSDNSAPHGRKNVLALHKRVDVGRPAALARAHPLAIHLDAFRRAKRVAALAGGVRTAHGCPARPKLALEGASRNVAFGRGCAV